MLFNRSGKFLLVMCLVSLVIPACLPVVTPVASLEEPSGVHLVAEPSMQPLNRRQVLEALFVAAVISQEYYARQDTILVFWPDGLTVRGELTIRIQKPDGRIYLERNFVAMASAEVDLGKAYLLPAGEYDIVLMPTPGEYHVEGLRIARRIRIWVDADRTK